MKRTRERALIEGGSEVSREGRRTNVEKKRRKGEIHGRGNPDHVRGPGTPFASYVSRKYALSVSVRRKNRRTRSRSVLASEFRCRSIARSKKTKIKKGRRRSNESRTSKGSLGSFGQPRERRYAVSVFDKRYLSLGSRLAVRFLSRDRGVDQARSTSRNKDVRRRNRGICRFPVYRRCSSRGDSRFPCSLRFSSSSSSSSSHPFTRVTRFPRKNSPATFHVASRFTALRCNPFPPSELYRSSDVSFLSVLRSERETKTK